MNILNPYIKEKILRYFPYAIWVFLIFFCTIYFIEIKNGGHGWKTGDWLINYNDGLVRRGLIGTALISISNLGISLKWLAFTFQVSLYIFIYSVVLQIYNLRKRSKEWFLILYSPAFLLFPFYFPGGGFRKEILIFTSFSILCLSYAKDHLKTTALISSILLYGLAAFSHELTVFSLPFFIYILYKLHAKNILGKNYFYTSCTLLVAISISAFIFSSIFIRVPESTCENLIKRGLNNSICGGAILWLQKDPTYGFEIVKKILPQSLHLYIPLFILSIIPIWVFNWPKKETVILMIIALISMGPLFIYAVDWGRWIHIYIFFIFMLILSETSIDLTKIQKIPVFILISYLSLWSLPHCCEKNFGPGIFEKTLNILSLVKN